MLNTKEPQKIYENLNSSILVILDKLKIKTDDEKFELSKAEILNLIDAFKQEKLDKAIDDLKKSQEWENFTVAFYGETNAGKSTIIETLRIYFQEENKIKQQNEFRKITQEYNENKRTFEFKMESIKNDIIEKETNREQLIIDFKAQENDLNQKLNQIVSDDSKKKESSIIYKILSLLSIINIQKEINKINSEINHKKLKYEEEARSVDNILKTQNDELIKLEEDIKSLETMTQKTLKNLVDGQIIGDGSPDFTKKSTTYNFTYNNQKFAFLDVPGIEGNETIVIDEISQAVRKAHAVFYVTSSSKLPEKGTLEKIKEHLGLQTEVYSIFNKRVTNPKYLTKASLSDDKESLKILDERMIEILGENYAGNKIVSAKIAFLALADCLLVKSNVLEIFSPDELIEKSNFNNLCSFITDKLVINTKQKIKKSNYNKASKLLNELIHILDKASKDNFEPLYKQIGQEVNDASSNLQNTLRKTKIDLESVIQKSLRDFESNTRKEIYKYIDSNVNNKSFKNKFEELLEKEYEKIGQQIPVCIEKELSKFQKSIIDSLENFKRRVDLAVQEYQTFDFGNFDSKFVIDLKMDNGINGWGVAGSFLAAGTTAYTYWVIAAANSWNWVGWTMIALGALTALISFGKSIYKFFSDDYKKSEQRKSADENIENVINTIKPKMLENIKPIYADISKLVDAIIDDLENIVRQRKATNEYIKTIHQDLILISKLIKIEGEK